MLLNLFELVGNNALEHGPKTSQRLAELQGKTLALRISNLNQTIIIKPSSDGIELSQQEFEDVDVTLSATVGAMIKIGRDGMHNAKLEPGELEIHGDPIIGQRFAQLVSELDINWESLLSEHLGEAPAQVVSLAIQQVGKLAEHTKDATMTQINSLITDELQITASTLDVDHFLEDVDHLRAQTDRLAARITRIQTLIGDE